MDASKVEPPQTYRVRWAKHTDNMIQTLTEQLDDEGLVDVTLSCEKQFIKAHKVILSCCSLYFKELFQHYNVPHPLIILNGISFSHLKLVIQFMYGGEIKIPEGEIDALLGIAENLQVKGLCKLSKSEPTAARVSEEAPSDVKYEPKEAPNVVEDKGLFNSSANAQSRKRRKQSLSFLHTVNDLPSIEQVNGQLTSESDEVVRTKVAKTCTSPLENKDSVPSSDAKINDKEKQKIPRPQNAFMIFANTMRRKLAMQHFGESNKEISVRLGNLWKTLPIPIKNNYYVAAKKADQEHKLKYPDYVYSPKQPKGKRLSKVSPTKPFSGYPIFLPAEAVLEVHSEDENTEVDCNLSETNDND